MSVSSLNVFLWPVTEVLISTGPSRSLLIHSGQKGKFVLINLSEVTFV